MVKLSIYLNQDDIKNIDSAETRQKIIEAVSKCVKEVAVTAQAIEIDIFAAPTTPVFTKESTFFQMIGSGNGPSDLAENHDQYIVEVDHE